MTENFNKIFIDTAPLIYLIEKNDLFYETTKEIFATYVTNKYELYTSTITVTEFGVVPYKENRKSVITDFEKILNLANINVKDINYPTAETAYKLRAKYQFLKTPDALQLATAIYNNCNKFLTNDKKLKQISEIEIVLISD